MITPELFEDLLTWTRKNGLIPRISAVCLDNGREIFSGGRGHRAHAETRYPIASITKTLTAHLVQHSLNEKGWNLQTPVHDLLSTFHLRHPRSQSLNSHDLLNHQTPMPVHLWAWLFGDVDRRTFVESRLPNLECFQDLKPRYRYSNIMYAVLGLLVEELTGKPWEKFLQTDLLDDLHMDQTTFIHPEWENGAHVAPPMQLAPEGTKPMAPFFSRENHLIAPASELISTAKDLTLWAQHANRIQPWKGSDAVRLRTARPTPNLQPLYSSNGWRMETFGAHKLFWHSGQCSGYTGILACMPHRNFSLAVLCNLDGAVDALQAMMYSAADLALSHPPKDWFEAFGAGKKQAQIHAGEAPASPTAVPLQPGTYTNSGYGALDITSDGHVLFQNTEKGFFCPSGVHFPRREKTFEAHVPSGSLPTVRIKFEPSAQGIAFVNEP